MQFDRESKWRNATEGYGTLATVGKQQVFHVLYDWYTAKHGGPGQEAARKRLSTNYWEACVQSLMPWLEPRRQEILRILRKPLQEHLAETGGLFVRRRTGKDGTRREEPPKQIDEMDFGDLTSLKYAKPALRLSIGREQRVFDLCHSIIKVRNDVAHMRCPNKEHVISMIEEVDGFFPDL